METRTSRCVQSFGKSNQHPPLNKGLRARVCVSLLDADGRMYDGNMVSLNFWHNQNFIYLWFQGGRMGEKGITRRFFMTYLSGSIQIRSTQLQCITTLSKLCYFHVLFFFFGFSGGLGKSHLLKSLNHKATLVLQPFTARECTARWVIQVAFLLPLISCQPCSDLFTSIPSPYAEEICFVG